MREIKVEESVHRDSPTLSASEALVYWHEKLLLQETCIGWPCFLPCPDTLFALHSALLLCLSDCSSLLVLYSTQSAKSSLHMLGEQSPKSPGVYDLTATLNLVHPACRARCPGCGRCTCYSYWEPQVRAGWPVWTTGEHDKAWQAPPPEVLPLPNWCCWKFWSNNIMIFTGETKGTKSQEWPV